MGSGYEKRARLRGKKRVILFIIFFLTKRTRCRLNDMKRPIPSVRVAAYYQQIVENGPNVKTTHHASHENRTIEPILDGGATALSVIDIPLGIEVQRIHRWPRQGSRDPQQGEQKKARVLSIERFSLYTDYTSRMGRSYLSYRRMNNRHHQRACFSHQKMPLFIYVCVPEFDLVI